VAFTFRVRLLSEKQQKKILLELTQADIRILDLQIYMNERDLACMLPLQPKLGEKEGCFVLDTCHRRHSGLVHYDY
jgi:hypothetical protein